MTPIHQQIAALAARHAVLLAAGALAVVILIAIAVVGYELQTKRKTGRQ